MRSAVLGAAIHDPQLLPQFVRESARITHSDPRAEYAALAVALAAHLAAKGDLVPGDLFMNKFDQLVDPRADELVALIGRAVASADKGEPTRSFADSLGLERGVTGYAYHTVPVALHAWLRYQCDFRMAVTEVIRCGGDTDTTGAIVGGIVGAAVGKPAIPPEWLDGIWEWPRTIAWMERLAGQLEMSSDTRQSNRPNRLPIYGVIPRNLLFLSIVLAHGLRRIFPPY
jgi:ADP-ribosylglycohydrolase